MITLKEYQSRVLDSLRDKTTGPPACRWALILPATNCSSA
jgi:hypothetical protein